MLKGKKFDAFALLLPINSLFKGFGCPFKGFECPFRGFECPFKGFEQRFQCGLTILVE